ncbi:hypothetical protein Asp14428_06170 [Actinoplanes sp. NBRC 14428]|nr:hypothetical protein Asp14428_06170 [Actinoplanes sp. NBRC 14428]
MWPSRDRGFIRGRPPRPFLVRLADRGLLEAIWEPSRRRDARHLYRLMAAGLKPADQVAPPGS